MEVYQKRNIDEHRSITTTTKTINKEFNTANITMNKRLKI